MLRLYPLSTFNVVEPAAFVRQGSSPHYYVEVDGAGELVAAAFNGNPVTAQTQDPTLEDDFTKLYRVGSDGRGDTHQVPAGVNNDPEGPQYDPLTVGGFYFGVWERRVDGIRTGMWNGQVVPLTTKTDRRA